MNVAVFGASTSSTSINKKLAVAAASLLREHRSDATIRVLDLRDYPMPLFSEDEERANGSPEAARRLLGDIQAADALIISLAEHNGSYTAAYKNAFDWMSRLSRQVYGGKRILALSTSPGPGGATSVLGAFTNSAPHFGATIVASLSVPKFQTAYDGNTDTLTPEWKERLRPLVAKL